MTNQEAFTIAVQHTRTQGIPSRLSFPELKCLYRHPDGIRKCIVGALIPDREYSRHMEDVSLYVVVTMTPSLRSINIYLLMELQKAHDAMITTTPWLEWMEIEFIRIARDFELQVPPHPCSVESTDVSNKCINNDVQQLENVNA